MENVIAAARAWLTPERFDPKHLFTNSRREPCRWMDATRASLEGAIAIATHGRGTPSKQALYNAAIDELERRNNGQPLMNVTTYEKAKELLQ